MSGQTGGRWQPAHNRQPHVAAFGLTGSGKSRRLLGPAIVAHGRAPVVAISAKDDLLDLCWSRRASLGPVYVLDFTGTARIPDHDAVIPVRFDPCQGVYDEDTALDLAQLLMTVGSLGSGGGSGGMGEGGAFWASLVSPALAGLLLTGAEFSRDEDSPVTSGIAWARAATGNVYAPKLPLGESLTGYEATWETGLAHLGEDNVLGEALHSSISLDERAQSSQQMTMRSGIAPWLRPKVLGDEDLPLFVPEMTEPGDDGSAPTVFVIARARGSAAGAASAFVRTLFSHWETHWAEIPGESELLVAIDEFSQTAPLPNIQEDLNTLRSARVRFMAAMQSSTQLGVFGATEAAILERTFPTILVMNAPEIDLLKRACELEGEREIHSMRASTVDTGRLSERHETVGRSEDVSYRPRVTLDDALPPLGSHTARVLDGGRLGPLVDLPDFSEIFR